MAMNDFIGSRFYCCFRCRNMLAAHDDIFNKDYMAGRRRSFLFSNTINTEEGPKEDKHLISGIHTVADVHCGDCREKLGWKYYNAQDHHNKHKVGKTVLIKFKIAKSFDGVFY